MTIVGFDKAEAFWKRHADAKAPLLRWYSLTLQLTWRNLIDVRRTFPSADQVGECVVFNIAGNKYRLIGKIHYDLQTVNVKFVLSHREYDRGAWKTDC